MWQEQGGQAATCSESLKGTDVRYSTNPGPTALQPWCELDTPLRPSEHPKGGRRRLHGWPWPCSTAPNAHTPTWPSASPHLAQPSEPPQAATHPTQPPGSLASTLPTTPDPAQPISSRAAARPAPIQRHRPWPGRCARTLRSPSLPFGSKGGRLLDAVTAPPALLSAKEVSGVGSGPPPPWRSRAKTEQGRAKRSRRRQSATSAKRSKD